MSKTAGHGNTQRASGDGFVWLISGVQFVFVRMCPALLKYLSILFLNISTHGQHSRTHPVILHKIYLVTIMLLLRTITTLKALVDRVITCVLLYTVVSINLFNFRIDEAADWVSYESQTSVVTDRTDDRKPLARARDKGQKMSQNGRIRHRYKSGESPEGWCTCHTLRVSRICCVPLIAPINGLFTKETYLRCGRDDG